MNNLKAERTLTAEELDTILAIGEHEQSGRVTNYELKELVRVYRLQSLSTQQPVGEVKVKPLEWQFIDGGRNISFWRAPNPLGGLPFEATSQEQMKQREDRYSALVLSALHPNQESGE